MFLKLRMLIKKIQCIKVVYFQFLMCDECCQKVGLTVKLPVVLRKTKIRLKENQAVSNISSN